jgi:cobalt-zinc-cadmium efflux system outer membrane protein
LRFKGPIFMNVAAFFSGVTICVVLFVSVSLRAQTTMDFPTVLELARKSNPDWRVAEQEIEIARGKLTTARILPFNPVLEGEGGPRTIPGEGKHADYGVGLSMELEVAGQRGLRIAEAERNLQRAEATYRDFTRTFTAKLARAFFQALFARERLALLKRVEDLNRRLLNVTQIKFQAGDVSGLETNVAAVRYGRARKEVLDGQRDLNQALLELRRLIGVEELITPAGELPVVSSQASPAELLERARLNRPDLAAKLRELERADAEIALRRREIFPNPSVGISFRREGTGDKIAMGSLAIPLPIFNRRQGELESLEARRIQARAELVALETDIRKEVDQALNQWTTALESFQLFQREIIERTEENFKLLEAAYRERKIDFAQALIMENDLIAANLSYLDTSLALRDAAIRLQEVAGEVR